jgi:hypothetical protein
VGHHSEHQYPVRVHIEDILYDSNVKSDIMNLLKERGLATDDEAPAAGTIRKGASSSPYVGRGQAVVGLGPVYSRQRLRVA